MNWLKQALNEDVPQTGHCLTKEFAHMQEQAQALATAPLEKARADFTSILIEPSFFKESTSPGEKHSPKHAWHASKQTESPNVSQIRRMLKNLDLLRKRGAKERRYPISSLCTGDDGEPIGFSCILRDSERTSKCLLVKVPGEDSLSRVPLVHARAFTPCAGEPDIVWIDTATAVGQRRGVEGRSV